MTSSTRSRVACRFALWDPRLPGETLWNHETKGGTKLSRRYNLGWVKEKEREREKGREREWGKKSRGVRRRSTSARIAERCATAAPDTSFVWNVYQHRRWLIIIPRVRMHVRLPVRSFVLKLSLCASRTRNESSSERFNSFLDYINLCRLWKQNVYYRRIRSFRLCYCITCLHRSVLLIQF